MCYTLATAKPQVQEVFSHCSCHNSQLSNSRLPKRGTLEACDHDGNNTVDTCVTPSIVCAPYLSKLGPSASS